MPFDQLIDEIDLHEGVGYYDLAAWPIWRTTHRSE